eukprot:2739760-Pyramimonas_sp.AAC.1
MSRRRPPGAAPRRRLPGAGPQAPPVPFCCGLSQASPSRPALCRRAPACVSRRSIRQGGDGS